MRLTRSEENKIYSEGIIILLVLAILLAGILFGGNRMISGLKTEQASILMGNQSLLLGNRKDMKEVKFFRENQQAIEAMWSTLKGWGGGVAIGALRPLTQVGITEGIPLPSTKTPGNPTEYSGYMVMGEKSEFQRLMEAISLIEAQQGLLQIRSATFQLPIDMAPNGGKPTYLNTKMELVAPNSK
jgi:hypothetical protein